MSHLNKVPTEQHRIDKIYREFNLSPKQLCLSGNSTAHSGAEWSGLHNVNVFKHILFKLIYYHYREIG